MDHFFKAVKVSDHVYWVGAIDWTIRDFHGYTTRRGSTYNAYLVLADKITLMDTVKAPFKEEMLSRIASIIDPKSIQYIVSNHSEMDHSGCLPDVIDAVKPEKVFASTMGTKTLKELFHAGLNIVPLKDGDRLSLGNMNLAFMETRMLHWPDSMFSYLAEENVLFFHRTPSACIWQHQSVLPTRSTPPFSVTKHPLIMPTSSCPILISC